MRYRLCEVEEKVLEMKLDTDYDIAELDGAELVLSGWWVYIPDLDLSLCPGTVCMWDDEGKIFMPDFDVTVIHEGKVTGQADTLFYKPDGIISTLDEWLGGSIDMDRLEQLWCELIIPENNKKE